MVAGGGGGQFSMLALGRGGGILLGASAACQAQTMHANLGHTSGLTALGTDWAQRWPLSSLTVARWSAFRCSDAFKKSLCTRAQHKCTVGTAGRSQIASTRGGGGGRHSPTGCPCVEKCHRSVGNRINFHSNVGQSVRAPWE